MPAIAKKRVAVLSDHDGLFRAIKVILTYSLNVEVVRLSRVHGVKLQAAGSDQLDLIVVAASWPRSEPLVALARASLANRIGQVPLLIISDRHFDAEPDVQIAHLPFPFSSQELSWQIRALLQDERVPAREWLPA